LLEYGVLKSVPFLLAHPVGGRYEYITLERDVLLCLFYSVVSHDSVFEFVEPISRNVISSVESAEEENIYDCPRPARGLLPNVPI